MSPQAAFTLNVLYHWQSLPFLFLLLFLKRKSRAQKCYFLYMAGCYLHLSRAHILKKKIIIIKKKSVRASCLIFYILRWGAGECLPLWFPLDSSQSYLGVASLWEVTVMTDQGLIQNSIFVLSVPHNWNRRILSTLVWRTPEKTRFC